MDPGGGPLFFSRRDKFVALIVSSLVAGLIVLANTDRHSSQPGIELVGASQHGWPLIYLYRQHRDPAMAARPFRWPLPRVNDEARNFSATNLITNVMVGVCIVGITYMLTNFAVNHVFPNSST